MASLSGPKIPRLERYTLNTPWIQSWIQKFEGNQLKDWAIEYGMGLTLTLLKVNLNWNAIQGAIPFWDPTYSVFRFKLNEMTPTIEEFELYLQLKDNGEPIRPSLKDSYKVEASKFFDLKRSELKNSFSGHLAFTRTSKEFLTEKVQGKKNEKPRVWLDTFTLVVLAHFFFPCRGNTINLALMEIVNQLKAGLRLAPMVLAQMYHALNMCSTGNRKFQACAPLLQMWLFEHIGVVEKNLQLNLPRPADWHSYLALIDENEDLRWEGTFHIAKSPILAFKNRRCLALIGLTHSLVYYPIRVLRQFGQPQGIPIEESLEDLVGPMTKKLQNGLAFEWRTLLKHEEPMFSAQHYQEYKLWMAAQFMKDDDSHTAEPGSKSAPPLGICGDHMKELHLTHSRPKSTLLESEKEYRRKIEELELALEAERQRADDMECMVNKLLHAQKRRDLSSHYDD